jgi:predicted nucleic acid-binding protein
LTRATVLLLVSDTNILLDWEDGGRLDVLFALGATLVIPDVLLAEELADRAARLKEFGLQAQPLGPEGIVRAATLARTHRKPGRIDLLALALAEQEGCPLLTGDRDLRAAAEAEGVVVHGSLWLAEEAVAVGALAASELRSVYRRMREAGRRLPWKEVEAQLRRLGEPGW